MHIGVDLDNTILDATTPHLHYYNQVSGLAITPADVSDFYLYRHYGWTEVELEPIYRQYGHDIHWSSSPLPMASEILQQLFGQHQISFITSRPLLFREVTMAWLKEHKFTYHHLHCAVENKLQACLDMGVDVMIDDGPHYAEAFALAGKPLILYEQPYNLSVTSESIYRASSWLDVKKHLENLAGKSNEGF